MRTCSQRNIFGVVQSRLLKVPLRRRHLIPCVLHLLIFVGRQALVRRLAKSVRPNTRVSVQAILHRSGCHIALQGTAEPDGEEIWCLLKVWEDLAPLLGGDMRMHTAVVAMYILLDVARCYSHYSGHKALWPRNVFGGSFGREQQGAERHLVLLL